MTQPNDPYGVSDLKPDFSPGPDGVYWTSYGSPVQDAAYWTAGQNQYTADPTLTAGMPSWLAGAPSGASGQIPGDPLNGAFSASGPLPVQMPDLGAADSFTSGLDPADVSSVDDSLSELSPNAVAALVAAVNGTPPRLIQTTATPAMPALRASIGGEPPWPASGVPAAALPRAPAWAMDTTPGGASRMAAGPDEPPAPDEPDTPRSPENQPYPAVGANEPVLPPIQPWAAPMTRQQAQDELYRYAIGGMGMESGDPLPPAVLSDIDSIVADAQDGAMSSF